MLLTFTSITLGYTTLILSYNLYTSKNYEEDTVSRKNKTFINQIRDNLDSKFYMAKNVVDYMKYNEHLLAYKEQDKIDYYLAFKLQNVFSRNQTSFSELGYMISVLKEGSDMVITPFGTRNLNAFLQENGINQAYNRYIKKSFTETDDFPMIEGNLLRKPYTSEIPFTGKSITITEKFFDDTNKVLFFLVFFEKTLIPHDMVNSTDALIIYEGNRVLFNNSPFNNRIIYDLIHKDIEIESYSSYLAKSSVIPNGGYIYLTPDHSTLTLLNRNLLNTIIIYIILIAFSLTLSVYITKKNYKPINHLLDSLNWQGHDKDEFHFIQESARRIQEANTELSKSIDQDKMPLKNKFLKDTLNGLLKESEIEASLDKYEIDRHCKNYTVVVIQFNNDQIFSNFSNETLLNIRNSVTRIIIEHLKQHCQFEIAEIDYHLTAAILYRIKTDDIRNLFKTILSDLTINEELDITASIGISVENFKDIKQSYFTSVTELDKWDGLGKTLLPLNNVEENQSSINFFYPLDTERRIIKYITTGKEDSLSLIHSVIDRNKYSLHLSNKEWKSFISAIIRTIKRVLIQINKTEKMFIGDNSLQDFVFAESRSSEDKNIITIFKSILESVQETSQGEQKTFADKLIKYISENYSDPNLSLIDIAEYFNLSPAYISRIFKDFTGRNFKDLLSDERINKSKEILTENPNIKVYKLGEEVGFNSTNTFLRTFKKYTGISPGKFAKSVLEG